MKLTRNNNKHRNRNQFVATVTQSDETGLCSAVWSGTFPHPPHRLVPSFVQLLLAHAPFRSLASPPAWVAIAAIQSHSRMTNTLQRQPRSTAPCAVPHTLACTLIGVPLTSGVVGGDIVVQFADSVRRRRADWRCWLDRQICQLIEWVTTHLICVHASHAVHGVLHDHCVHGSVRQSVRWPVRGSACLSVCLCACALHPIFCAQWSWMHADTVNCGNTGTTDTDDTPTEGLAVDSPPPCSDVFAARPPCWHEVSYLMRCTPSRLQFVCLLP